MMPHQPGPDTPASARVFDYWAGGRDHYRPDRELADAIAEICPGAPRTARHNRESTGRAVAWAAREGAAQFLDLGCGYPLGTEIHDIARAVNPAATVAYVDADEDVVNYASWLFGEDQKLKGITVARADLRDPALCSRTRASGRSSR